MLYCFIYEGIFHPIKLILLQILSLIILCNDLIISYIIAHVLNMILSCNVECDLHAILHFLILLLIYFSLVKLNDLDNRDSLCILLFASEIKFSSKFGPFPFRSLQWHFLERKSVNIWAQNGKLQVPKMKPYQRDGDYGSPACGYYLKW